MDFQKGDDINEVQVEGAMGRVIHNKYPGTQILKPQ